MSYWGRGCHICRSVPEESRGRTGTLTESLISQLYSESQLTGRKRGMARGLTNSPRPKRTLRTDPWSGQTRRVGFSDPGNEDWLIEEKSLRSRNSSLLRLQTYRRPTRGAVPPIQSANLPRKKKKQKPWRRFRSWWAYVLEAVISVQSSAQGNRGS